LLPADERAVPGLAASTTGLTSTLLVLQRLAAAGIRAPLWSVTRAAVSTAAGDCLNRPGSAPIWGLGAVAALEHPQLWGGLIDLPEDADDALWSRAISALAQPRGEDELALRSAGLSGRRLRPVTSAGPEPGPPLDWTGPGTVLITDGTGEYGAAVARRLAQAGDAQLLLTVAPGTGADPGALALTDELGPRAALVECELTDRDAVAALLAGLPGHAPLIAVVHTAQVLEEAALVDTTPERLDRVLAGGALVARHLHDLTGDLDLRAFVLFSSFPAILGAGAGLGAFAAANGYLDALARHRRDQGLAGTCVAWGAWARDLDDRIDEVERSRQARLVARGLPALRPDAALAELDRALALGLAGVLVADVRWERFLDRFTVSRPKQLIADLPEVRAILGRTTATATTDHVDPAARAEPFGQVDPSQALLTVVSAQIAAVLGHSGAQDVEPDRDFMELGLDSLTTVELGNLIEAATGIELDPGDVLTHPTPRALADHLLRESGRPAPSGPASGAAF
jgi:NAD(P)-dependent dehydrogenase (short-subunit alcohol dehydrogenase family)/acyl carrier protein